MNVSATTLLSSLFLILGPLAANPTMPKNLYDFKVKQLMGSEQSLADYKGQVVVVVNTASKCGLTPQYKGLEELYQKYKDRGLVVLGFPCNQFGGQEPGSPEEIQSFCQLNYGVSFPMFEKIEVNGDGTHPLYQWLKTEAPGLLGSTSIKWNFTKFLIDRQGKVVKRFSPKDKPASLVKDIERLL